VVLADIDADGVSDAQARITAAGGQVLGLRVDVADPESVDAMVSAVMREWGRVDVLVNSAGIGGLYHFLDEPLQHWQRTMAVNLTGVFLCGQAVARKMAKRQCGR